MCYQLHNKLSVPSGATKYHFMFVLHCHCNITQAFFIIQVKLCARHNAAITQQNVIINMR